MKIGILSDIHGYPDKFKRAMELFKDCQMVLCAGDILYHGPRNPILEGYNPRKLGEEIQSCKAPILFSRGNCDAEVDLMVLNLPLILPVVFYESNGVRFMVTHSHDMDENRLKEIAKAYEISIMIIGHTHIRKWYRDGNTLFVNPGSISVPKGDGIPSAAIYDDGVISFINIENGEIIEKVK